jgi:membrane protein YqaA with SNARE-associated domain
LPPARSAAIAKARIGAIASLLTTGRTSVLRALYDWTLRLAGHRHADRALAGVAFIESSVFPIPPDILLIAMIMARRERALRYAVICTVASVLGGLLGYAIGYGLWEAVGEPVLAFYGYGDRFAEFQALYNDWGAWIVFIAGLSPFPYKVITIASGVTALDIWVFMAASLLSRGLRFAVVAALLWYFGPPIRRFIEERLGLVFVVFCVVLVGGFVALRFWH